MLEIGCSTGALLASLKQEFKILPHGLDISHKSLAWASNLEPQGLWCLGNAERLPFQNERFDCVLAFDVLEHVSDMRCAVKEISRVLKPGGRALIHSPVADMGGSFDSIWKKWQREKYEAEQHSAGHLPGNIKRLDEMVTYCQEAGLNIIDTTRFNVFFQNIFDYRMRHPILWRLFPARRLPYSFYHSVFAPMIEALTILPDKLIGKANIGASAYLHVGRRH